MLKRWFAALALCSAAAAVSGCIGVPSGANIHVCVRLSEAAAAACGPPNGWPLPTGPSQGFWYETDDGSGSRSGVNQWVRNANFSVTSAGGTITFELVSRDGGSAGSADFACHPFAIVSRGASRERGGGCSRSGQSCAYGAQAGVTGPVPAYVTGQTVTLTAEINATYGYQSLDDTYMGGEIAVSNQFAPTGDGGDGGDDSSDGAAVKRGAMVAAIVIGIAAFVVLPLGLGARYARHHGYWTGCCVWKRNPNLAATGSGASATAGADVAVATAPAPTLSEVALDVHSGSGSGGAGAADVAHVKLSEDMPAAASDAPAVAAHVHGPGADAMR